MKTITGIIFGCLAMLVQSTAMALDMTICVTSQSGCAIAGGSYVENAPAGSPEFRDAVSMGLGIVRANREACPDASLQIMPNPTGGTVLACGPRGRKPTKVQ